MIKVMEEEPHEARNEAHGIQTKQGFDIRQTLVGETILIKMRWACQSDFLPEGLRRDSTALSPRAELPW